MKVIGLSGYARSGKDEAAAVLEREFDYKRISFADKVREVIFAINPIVDDGIRLQDVIYHYGWSGYKSTPYANEIRNLLQRTGTDGGRYILWNNIWVDAAFNGLDSDGKYVFADCRFPNEAEAVINHGGKIIRISRAGVGPANDHLSEVSLDKHNFDAVIKNDSTVEQFHLKIRTLMLTRNFLVN